MDWEQGVCGWTGNEVMGGLGTRGVRVDWERGVRGDWEQGVRVDWEQGVC